MLVPRMMFPLLMVGNLRPKDSIKPQASWSAFCQVAFGYLRVLQPWVWKSLVNVPCAAKLSVMRHTSSGAAPNLQLIQSLRFTQHNIFVEMSILRMLVYGLEACCLGALLKSNVWQMRSCV